MKRYLSFMLLFPILVGWLPTAVGAEVQNSAAAAAAQEEAEDRYRRLAAQVTGLKEAQDLHQQQMATLDKNIRDLSDQVTRAANNNVTQERLNQLAEQIKKVDEARIAENKKIFETIEELHRILKNMAAAPPPVRPTRTTPAPTTAASKTPGPAATEDGFEYAVQKNDTLSGIVQSYRQQNIKVSRKAIMDANPNVNWDRLRVGQKIFIPKPQT
jgi:LysM repeat protein